MMIFDDGRGERERARVRVCYGATRLTQEGDAVLRPGQDQALHGGRLLIEALEAVSSADPERARARPLAGALRRWHDSC